MYKEKLHILEAKIIMIVMVYKIISYLTGFLLLLKEVGIILLLGNLQDCMITIKIMLLN